MKIAICIPAYNEENTLGETIKCIKDVMDISEYKDLYEIHVQDDGSTDGTIIVAEGYLTKVFKNEFNLGLAKTFQKELQNAKDADIIVHTDADNQYQAEFIPSLIKGVQDGYDLVLGSRFLGKNYSGSFIKNIGNKAFASLLSKLIKQKVSDSTTGFRAFNQKVASLELINRFTYTQEQIIRAAKNGLKIAEVSIKTNKTRNSRLFKGPIDYAIRAFINLFRIYRDFDPIKFFGKIGLAFMFPGILLSLYVLFGLFITGTGQYTKYALAALFFLFTGIQIILFGFIADMNRRD